MNLLKSTSLSLALVTVFCFSACQEDVAVQEDTIDQVKVNQLVELANKKITDKEFTYYEQEFAKLNFDELEQYNRLDVAKLHALSGNENAAKISLELRQKANQLSMKRYGLPYNQVSTEKLNFLIDEAYYGPGNVPVPESNNNGRTSCPARQFPLSFTVGNTPVIDATDQVYEVASVTGGDCDCQYGFPTPYYTKIVPTYGTAEALLTRPKYLGGFNGSVLARRDGNATYVLLGKTRVAFYYGGCAVLLSEHLSLGY